MITTELFIILKLFTENEVSWLWVFFFLISDTMMWISLKNAIGGSR